MAVTFQLCAVARATRPLREAPLHAVIEALLGTSVEACGAATRTVVPASQNAFLAAAWRAFAGHHPLVLTPDAVWLCIAQGFAAHVNLHAEHLRGRFVGHQGRATLLVERDDFVKGSPDNRWPEVFSEVSEQIAGHIGRQRDLVVCDFSTTGPIERAVSELVLMDAMQQYFEYELHTLCGIPELTLTGTVDDWRSVRRRTEMLAEYGLEWWTSVLLPILDEFVAAAGGRPDLEVWRHFFKDRDGSGGPYLHGWILLFFPYFTGEEGAALRVNPIVAGARGASPIRFGGGLKPWARESHVSPGGIPLGIARAPLTWVYLGRKFAMDLVGGFVGVAQDPTTLALWPAIGWAVRDHAEAVIVRKSLALLPVSSAPDPGIDDATIDNMLLDDDSLYPPSAGISDDGVFLVSESVRCSRAATPSGRLILADTGLYFIPGVASDAAVAGVAAHWLGRALTDDDDAPPGRTDSFTALRGRPPGLQVAAVLDALQLDRPALASLAITLRGAPVSREPWRWRPGSAIEIAVRLSHGERLGFTLIDPPREPFIAWCTALGYRI